MKMHPLTIQEVNQKLVSADCEDAIRDLTPVLTPIDWWYLSNYKLNKVSLNFVLEFADKLHKEDLSESCHSFELAMSHPDLIDWDVYSWHANSFVVERHPDKINWMHFASLGAISSHMATMFINRLETFAYFLQHNPNAHYGAKYVVCGNREWITPTCSQTIEE